MQRRGVLAGFGSTFLLVGCVGQNTDAEDDETADGEDSDPGEDGTDATTDEADTDSTDTDTYGDEDVTTYRHELSDWFELEERDARVLISGTERHDGSDFGVETEDDVFILNMRATSMTDEPVQLAHEPFWIEKLGTDHPPVTDVSEQLENGATGEYSTLDPVEHRDLQLVFLVPPEIEPQYVWVDLHYICLV